MAEARGSSPLSSIPPAAGATRIVGAHEFPGMKMLEAQKSQGTAPRPPHETVPSPLETVGPALEKVSAGPVS
jgi:hypothetical protein